MPFFEKKAILEFFVYFHRSNPTHQLIDPIQPAGVWKFSTQSNPTPGSTQPMDNTELNKYKCFYLIKSK